MGSLLPNLADSDNSTLDNSMGETELPNVTSQNIFQTRMLATIFVMICKFKLWLSDYQGCEWDL